MSAERNKPDNSVLITAFNNGRIEVDTSFDQFQVMNTTAITLEGASLAEIASTDSQRAYRLIKALVRSVVMNASFSKISVNDRVVATDDQTFPDEMRAMAQTLVMNFPDEHSTAFDFSLGIFPSEADKELFGTETGRIPIVDIRVEPPDLAH